MVCDDDNMAVHEGQRQFRSFVIETLNELALSDTSQLFHFGLGGKYRTRTPESKKSTKVMFR